MARTYHFSDGNELSLAEYLDWVSCHVDPSDVESVAESAKMLYRLSLNKALFNDILLAPLKNSLESIQPANQYTDATLILGSAKEGALVVRGNLWKSPKRRNGSNAYESILYSYDIPHDHNFDFLTVGYFGPGYTTDIYTYSRTDLNLVVGEHVDIQFLETTTLEAGKVMLYEKSKDIHTQRPPVSPSISLNLICSTDDQYTRQQCFFDIQKSTFSGYAAGPTNSRVQTIKMVGELGIHEATDLLLDITKMHDCVRTRAAAIKSILEIDAGLVARVHDACAGDRHPLITDALENAGS